MEIRSYFIFLVLIGVSFTRISAEFLNDLDLSRVNEFATILHQRTPLKSHVEERTKRINLSMSCLQDVTEFMKSFRKHEVWTLKMLDASSKIPSGILMGKINDLGMYDECLSIRENKMKRDIRGRHCMYSLYPHQATNASNPKMPDLNLKLAVCVPSTCNAKDVEQIIEIVKDKITNISGIQDLDLLSVQATCSRIDSLDWGTGGIVTLVLIGLWFLFLTGCTFLEFMNSKNCLKNDIVELLSMFSFRKSALSIFNMKINPASFPVLNGIRFISIAWIVYGHSVGIFALSSISVNLAEIYQWVFSWKSLYIMLAPYSVDSFFTMSGFLMTYLFLKKSSGGEKFNILEYYLHRYIRLTPAIGMLLLIDIFIFPHLGSGPLWEYFSQDQCERSWWSIILYIQNFVHDDQSNHLWYVTVDSQLFLYSPVILYPLLKKPKIGLGILAASFVAVLIAIAKIMIENEYSISEISQLRRSKVSDFWNFYAIPYTRAGPWLVGILFGYMTATKKISISKKRAILGWLLSIACFLFCTTGIARAHVDDYEYNIVWEVLFGCLTRSIWALGLSWIIFASITGIGGPIGSLLSLPIFLPLSRLSYCLYLVHISLQSWITGTARVGTYFSDFQMFLEFLSELIVSIVLAFFLSITCESPFLILEKLLFRKTKKSGDNNRERKLPILTAKP